MNIKLREYQQECISIINSQPPGRYLIQLFTGGGKTVIFSHIWRQGRVLILSHREELVNQPIKYYDCPVGVECGDVTSHGESVVSASVQSMCRPNRLERFPADYFDTIIVDEAHHSASETYKTIINHFSDARLVLGFTATPNRGDKQRLDNVFSKIIFKRDLKWGIKNGYISDIYCKRVNIGFDLSAVRTRMGDYAPGELSDAMTGTEDAIAQAYREHAKGATLIFAVDVARAEAIAERIPGAVCVTGKTQNRSGIIERFTRREIPCLVNCMIFTEGTDIPLVETVIVARPTKSSSLYTQVVGRGLRLSPGKDKLTLIDCVGVSSNCSLCTAPSLLGIDVSELPPKAQEQMEGMLFDLPGKAVALSDSPASWIKNVKIVDLWAQEQQLNLHDVNFFKNPDGSLKVSLPNKKRIMIPCPDSLGKTLFHNQEIEMQEAIDEVYQELTECYSDSRPIWDLNAAKRWGKAPASEAQKSLIKRRCKKFDSEINYDRLSKLEASQILNRVCK